MSSDSISHFNASTSSLHMSFTGSSHGSYSGNTESSHKHSHGRYNNGHAALEKNNSSLTLKQQGWLAATLVLCLFSVLNFVKEASSVDAKQWNHAVYYMSHTDAGSTTTAAMQHAYAQEDFDLTLLEHDGGLNGDDMYQGTRGANNRNNQEGTTRLSVNEIPLNELVVSHLPTVCPAGLHPAPAVIAEHPLPKKIPPIVHMTGKSGCLTEPFYNATLQWSSFENHSFYFHTDEAVDELLFNKHWPMFPQLQNSMECLKNAGGAAKADLWRYLALWEYGGIYTDMDNLPGEYLNATTITPDMDAFFLQERGGWISQFFFAISPKHPLMFLAVHDVMNEMHNLEDTGNFYVPATTGPGATKRAFLKFMGMNSTWTQEQVKFYSKPPKGHYEAHNRSVTVEGSRMTGYQWLQRSAIARKDKKDGWQVMNISDYQLLNKQPSGTSCVMKLHDKYAVERHVQETLRTRRW